jgi:hypothetical protein
MPKLELLTSATDAAYGRLRKRLDGLTDDEFFWEPVAGCWTIHQDGGGRWTYDYAIPEPSPAPATTIGWQVVHLATTKVIYHEWAFGPARLTFPDLDIPHTAAGAVAMLERGHALLGDDLRALTEAGFDEPVRTNWGGLWPAWRIFQVMADHDALHGGAIGCLRDLYRWTVGG